MTILPLVTFPSPLLKQKSEEVDVIDKGLQDFMCNMIETMYQSSGVGLAAVQVGVLKRILVMDVNYKADFDQDYINIRNEKPIFMINPSIIEASKDVKAYQEGCLSFPSIRAEVKRPKKVTIKYLDYDGKNQELEAEGLLATCVQHEIDHLNGITFVDYLSKVKRDTLIKKVIKKQKLN